MCFFTGSFGPWILASRSSWCISPPTSISASFNFSLCSQKLTFHRGETLAYLGPFGIRLQSRTTDLLLTASPFDHGEVPFGSWPTQLDRQTDRQTCRYTSKTDSLCVSGQRAQTVRTLAASVTSLPTLISTLVVTSTDKKKKDTLGRPLRESLASVIVGRTYLHPSLGWGLRHFTFDHCSCDVKWSEPACV